MKQSYMSDVLCRILNCSSFYNNCSNNVNNIVYFIPIGMSSKTIINILCPFFAEILSPHFYLLPAFNHKLENHHGSWKVDCYTIKTVIFNNWLVMMIIIMIMIINMIIIIIITYCVVTITISPSSYHVHTIIIIKLVFANLMYWVPSYNV